MKNNEDFPNIILHEGPLERDCNQTISFLEGQSRDKNILNQHEYPFENSVTYKSMQKQKKSLLVSHYLSTVKSYLSEKLITSQNFTDIQSIARHFPGSLTSFMILECHLDKAISSRTDLAFAVSCRQEDKQELMNFLEELNLPETFWLLPAWCKVGDFAVTWPDPNSILYNNVIAFWLEFDVLDNPPATPIPSVFIGPTHIRGGIAGDSSEYEWLTRTALPLLLGKRLPELVERRLLDCIQRMPEGASVFQVGTMLSRPASDVRLCVNGLRPKKIVSYLNEIGWSDDTGEFESLISELSGQVNRFVLNFNVNDCIGPSIGVECSFAPNQFQHETRWSNFLDYLVEKGLCSTDKRNALMQFPGLECEETSSVKWPRSFAATSKILANGFSNAIVRYINHIKIVYRPDHSLEAKAYLSVRHFQLPSPCIINNQEI